MTLAPCDDGGLVAQIEAGSTPAFEALYDRYAARAYRVARGVCGDDGRAEEAVQEAFVSIWRSRTAYLPHRGTVAIWLLSVVRYRAIDVARRHGSHASHRAGEHMTALLPAPGDMADQAMARADAPRLHALLRRLPHAQQEVITLAFYGQMSYAEIAAQLGLPAGTVKGRIRLGLQKLRADIDRVVA